MAPCVEESPRVIVEIPPLNPQQRACLCESMAQVWRVPALTSSIMGEGRSTEEGGLIWPDPMLSKFSW